LRVHPVNAKDYELLITFPFSRLAGKQQHSGNAYQQEEAKLLDS
jgi:hypothetical protein